jgi:carboxymethylenebutenolidase
MLAVLLLTQAFTQVFIAQVFIPVHLQAQQLKSNKSRKSNYAQENSVCCAPAPKSITKAKTSPTDNRHRGSSARLFASLAADSDFRAAHLEPLPFSLDSAKGTIIAVKAADGSECSGYEVKPASQQSAPAPKTVVFMFHEWWGLNDYIKREAERLSEALGVTVIALDLYDKTVATTREEAGKAMQSLSAERAKTIIQAFAAYVGKDARIGTIGWCMGGTWSMQSALLLGKQAKACIIYYGQPETDGNKLATLNAPVLCIIGKLDRWITPEVGASFEKAMKAAGKSIELKIYDADHAFANPSNPRFHKAFSDDAHALTLNFFKKYLL